MHLGRCPVCVGKNFGVGAQYLIYQALRTRAEWKPMMLMMLTPCGPEDRNVTRRYRQSNPQ